MSTTVITVPTVGSKKFVLTKDDAGMYLMFATDVLVNSSPLINKDQKEAIKDLSKWISGEKPHLEKETVNKTLTFINYIHLMYDELIERMKQDRFENIELVEEMVEKGRVKEGDYNTYCKTSKKIWEMVDNGLYKLWFSRRGAVLEDYNPDADLMNVEAGFDCVNIKIIKKSDYKIVKKSNKKK